MVGTFPQAWQETALVAIQDLGGTARLFGAITETIDIAEPDYPSESIKNLAGGRLFLQKGQEDGEVTLEIYPIDATEGDNTGIFQWFQGGTEAAGRVRRVVFVRSRRGFSGASSRGLFARRTTLRRDSKTASPARLCRCPAAPAPGRNCPAGGRRARGFRLRRDTSNTSPWCWPTPSRRCRV